MIYVIVIALVAIIKVFKILKIKQFFHGKSLNDNDGRSSLILNSCPKDLRSLACTWEWHNSSTDYFIMMANWVLYLAVIVLIIEI